MVSMRQSGRINIITLLAIVGVVAVVGILFMSGESPSVAGNRFLLALHNRDVDAVAAMSYVDSDTKITPDQIKDKWAYTLNEATPSYQFVAKVNFSKLIAPEEAIISIEMYKDADSSSSYPELFQIKLIKQDGKWKVDIFDIPRKFYPALPKPTE